MYNLPAQAQITVDVFHNAFLSTNLLENEGWDIDRSPSHQIGIHRAKYQLHRVGMSKYQYVFMMRHNGNYDSTRHLPVSTASSVKEGGMRRSKRGRKAKTNNDNSNSLSNFLNSSASLPTNSSSSQARTKRGRDEQGEEEINDNENDKKCAPYEKEKTSCSKWRKKINEYEAQLNFDGVTKMDLPLELQTLVDNIVHQR